MNSCSPEVESLQGLETSPFMLALKSLNGDLAISGNGVGF